MSQRSEDIHTSQAIWNFWPSASRIAWLVWMSSFHYDMTTHVWNGVKIRVQMSAGNVSVFCTLILEMFLNKLNIKILSQNTGLKHLKPKH